MSPAVSSGSSKKAPALKSLYTKLKGQQTSFNNISQFVEGFPEGTTASQITVRLERLDDLWEKISVSIYEIEAHDDFTENEAFSKERAEFENRYYDVKSFLLDRVKEFQEISTADQSVRLGETTIQGGMDHVRLPQIKLQQFDGNIDDWLSFRDLFCSLIHWKPDLPEVEKFHYLKGCLGGEAKALIDPLKITKPNYQIAWDTLIKRYNNSKLLKRKQVQSLVSLPSLGKESVSDLQGLLEGFERCIQTLDQIVQPADYKDLLLVNLLSSRLDPNTRRGWEEFSSNNEKDSLKDLTDFVQRRIRILESLPPKASEMRADFSQHDKRKPVIRSTHNAVQSSGGKCPACSESHLLHLCGTFQRMTVSNRESLLRSHSLCRNCLKRGHQARECSSRYTCRKCKGRHHSMLCFKGEQNKAVPRYKDTNHSTDNKEGQVTDQVADASSKSTVCSNVAYGKPTNVLLATAVILVEDDRGSRYPARALLDSGSECNFMTEKLSQRLKVQRERVDVSVLGIGQSAAKAKQRVRAIIKSRISSYSKPLNFLVLPRVTVDLPTTSVRTTGWEIPEGIELADPAFFKSSAVDIVLGIQAFFSLFQAGKEIALGEGLPHLTETVFGWIVSGEITELSASPAITICNTAVSKNLEALLSRFWSCEEVGVVDNYSPEEARCEEHFGRTVRRGTDGRYIVALPKNEAKFSDLGESREIAVKRNGIHNVRSYA